MAFYNSVLVTLHSSLSLVSPNIQLAKAIAPWNDPPASGKLVLQDSFTDPTAIEILTYTARTDHGAYWTLTGLVRGVENTPASFFVAGAFAFTAFTAADYTAVTPLTKPQLTYTDGALTRVDYANGAFKVLTYDDEGQCISVVTTNGEVVLIDQINWVDGVFQSIT